jgi:hypothetical protein
MTATIEISDDLFARAGVQAPILTFQTLVFSVGFASV